MRNVLDVGVELDPDVWIRRIGSAVGPAIDAPASQTIDIDDAIAVTAGGGPSTWRRPASVMFAPRGGRSARLSGSKVQAQASGTHHDQGRRGGLLDLVRPRSATGGARAV